MAAAIEGNAEFFAPETRMVPTSGLPPRMTNLSIKESSQLTAFSFQVSSVNAEEFEAEYEGTGRRRSYGERIIHQPSAIGRLTALQR